MISRKPDYDNLADSLRVGCLWTVILQALSLGLGVYVFSDWRLCALGLPLGWLPILAVALRRPEYPSRTDIGVVFGGFPIIFVGLALFDRLYFHVP
jgi:hypothetical protein